MLSVVDLTYYYGDSQIAALDIRLVCNVQLLGHAGYKQTLKKLKY